MENPRGLMQYETVLLEGLPPHERHTVSYCKYGYEYQKHTDIWTNDDTWDPIPACSAEYPCEIRAEHGKHLVGVRSHPEKGMTTGPQTLEERYQIPEKLILDIFEPYFFFFEDQERQRNVEPTKVCDFVQPMLKVPPEPEPESDSDLPDLVSNSSSSDEDNERPEFQTPRDAANGTGSIMTMISQSMAGGAA
jgi:hypothetical protein